MNYQDLVTNHTGKLIDQFLRHVLSEDSIEIHFDFFKNPRDQQEERQCIRFFISAVF